MKKKQSKKIGILMSGLAQVGGVGIAAIEEVRNLREMGYEVELVELSDMKNFSFQGFLEGVPRRILSRELPWPLNLSVKMPFFSFFHSFHLTMPFLAPLLIKKGEYEYFFCHETYNLLTALMLKWTRKIPFYALLWDPISYILPRVYQNKPLGRFLPIFLPLGKMVDRLVIKESEIVFLCSLYHSRLVGKLAGLKKKIVPLYPGCNPLAKIPRRRGDFIVALSKWDLGKNTPFMLEVLAGLRNKNTKLKIAGGWVQEGVKKDFLKRMDQLGLGDRVEILGRVSEEEKERLFSTARVLIHPIVEAFGMFGLEAAGCGCPIIIPQGSGVNDLFKDSVHGFFPQEGDVKRYVSCLDKLLKNERTAFKMGQTAWGIARRTTWRYHAESIVKIIEGSKKNG
jgi:glycosyltransferase involved in cell wall biosynthesis